jgi:ABC-2 type transport system permease protein
MSKYATILKVSLAERLVYRGNFFIGTVFRFFPIITSVLLWFAVFEGSGKDRIEGYSYPAMVGYFVLAMIARAFSSMPGLSRTVALDIREGLLNKFLLRPVDYITWMFMQRLAHKMIYYLMATLPFVALIWFLRWHGYFPGWPGTTVFLAFMTSLFLGFLIGYFLNLLMGLCAFWMLEITSFLFVMTMLEFFMSGHMIPLDLYPPVLADLCKILPFQYEVYVPAVIYIGKIPPSDLAPVLLAQFAWAIALWGTCRLLFALGVRRYTAFGG